VEQPPGRTDEKIKLLVSPVVPIVETALSKRASRETTMRVLNAISVRRQASYDKIVLSPSKKTGLVSILAITAGPDRRR